MAVCTSTTALSMLRSRSNVIVMLALPVPLREVISSTPAIVVNWRSSGLATVAAIVAGSPPGHRGAHVHRRAYPPSAEPLTLAGPGRRPCRTSAMAPRARLVAIGRRMNGSRCSRRDPSGPLTPDAPVLVLTGRQTDGESAGGAIGRRRPAAVGCRLRPPPCPFWSARSGQHPALAAPALSVLAIAPPWALTSILTRPGPRWR